MTQENVVLDEVGGFTDHELVARLHRLVRADQTLSARLLLHLGEVDARMLYREHACASMFTYCVEQLHMSEAQAYLRIQAARLGRKFPLIVQRLAQGSLHLTAIKLLGPHLTEENHAELLERASGKGKREIELLVAALAPKPDVPSRMRKLPEAQPVPADVTEVQAQAASTLVEASQAPLLAAPPSIDSVTKNRAPFTLEAPRQRASSAPLSPGRYKVEFTAAEAMHSKLEQLKNLLRHQVPNGDLAIILEQAVDLLLDKTMRRRFAQTRVPKTRSAIKRRAGSRKIRSRYIPRAVVREVHARDGGRCTFVSADGRRCSERGFLEFHHHSVPYAKGGEATAENLRLACRAHNALFAERDFGKSVMRSKVLHARVRTRREGEGSRKLTTGS